MATKADIVTRTAEILQLVGEGQTLPSSDRNSIERAIDDIYEFERLEIPFTWDLGTVPDASLGPMAMYAAAMSARACAADEPERHEAGLEFAKRNLRVVNRTKPDNDTPVEAEHY